MVVAAGTAVVGVVGIVAALVVAHTVAAAVVADSYCSYPSLQRTAVCTGAVVAVVYTAVAQHIVADVVVVVHKDRIAAAVAGCTCDEERGSRVSYKNDYSAPSEATMQR